MIAFIHGKGSECIVENSICTFVSDYMAWVDNFTIPIGDLKSETTPVALMKKQTVHAILDPKLYTQEDVSDSKFCSMLLSQVVETGIN